MSEFIGEVELPGEEKLGRVGELEGLGGSGGRGGRGGRGGVLFAVWLAGACTFLTLYATQPLLPMLREIFGVSEFWASLTVSAPVLAVALAAPFVGMLADATGRKRVIVASMLILAVPTLLAATAHGLMDLLLWRFLQGLFIPGIIAVTMAYISEESPAGRVGITMASYVTGTVIGGFLGRFITGLCATHWNWRAGFAILGAATILGGLVTWRLLPRSERFVRQKNPTASVRAMGRHLRNKQLLVTFAVGFNVLFSLVGTFTYINYYLALPPFSLNAAMLGSMFFVYLIGAVITPLAGRWLDRVGYRRSLIGALLVAAVGILLTLAPSLPVVIAGLALCCSGVFVCQAAASGRVGKVAGGARSSAAGLYVAFYYSGGLAGSIVPVYFWSYGGWPWCVGLMVGVQLLTGMLAFWTWRN